MANVFSSICEMNLVSPPQPCSGRRTHRVEFQFSDNSRLQVFVCAKHSSDVGSVERALAASGEFPLEAYVTAISTKEISNVSFAPARLAVAGAK